MKTPVSTATSGEHTSQDARTADIGNDSSYKWTRLPCGLALCEPTNGENGPKHQGIHSDCVNKGKPPKKTIAVMMMAFPPHLASAYMDLLLGEDAD